MLLFNHSGCDNMASGVEELRSDAHLIMTPFQKELKLSAIFIGLDKAVCLRQILQI